MFYVYVVTAFFGRAYTAIASIKTVLVTLLSNNYFVLWQDDL